MDRDALVKDIDRLAFELDAARRALKRHDWRERMRVSGTATARVLAVIEVHPGGVSMRSIVDAIGWKSYGTVASALSNMKHRGVIERVSQGVYRATGVV